MDLSNLSDAELQAIVNAQENPTAPPVAGAAAPSAAQARAAGAGLDLTKLSDAELQRFAATPVVPDVTADVAKQFASGAAEGAGMIAGLPGDVKDLVGKGVQAAGSALGLPEPKPMPPPDTTLSRVRAALEPPTSPQVMSKIEGLTGPLPQPETTAGRYARSVGQFAPMAIAAPEGVSAAGLARYAVAPGLASEAAGQFTRGTPYEAPARMVAALAAPGAAGRAITPLPASAERLAYVNALRGAGVNSMTPGQISGRSPMRYLESTLADVPLTGTSAEAINEGAAHQFTRAAMRAGGQDSVASAPAMRVMDAANGAEFNRLTAAHRMPLDPQVQNDMLGAVARYTHNTNPAVASPLPENIMNEAAATASAQGGHLTGAQYQDLRSRLGRAAAGSSDPGYAEVLAHMRNALDDAMERHLATAAPQDVGAFGAVRQRYRNQLILERAAAGGGGADYITPAALKQAVKSVEGTRDYVQGNSEMGQLARAGQEILAPLPQSGTGPRMAILEQLGLAGMLGLGGEHAGGVGAAALAALTGPPALGRAMFSRPGQTYLGNQVVPKVPFNEDLAKQAIMARALAQMPQQQQQPRALPPP